MMRCSASPDGIRQEVEANRQLYAELLPMLVMNSAEKWVLIDCQRVIAIAPTMSDLWDLRETPAAVVYRIPRAVLQELSGCVVPHPTA